MPCQNNHHYPLEDTANGCVVCTECGLVLSDMVTVADRSVGQPEPNSAFPTHLILRNFLLDTLSLMHRDCAVIIDSIFSEMHMYAWEKNDHSVMELNPARSGERAKLALFTWCALQSDKVNHTPIARLLEVFDISREQFIRAEKQLNWSSSFVSASDTVEMVCTRLGTTFPFMMMLKECVKTMDHLVRRPEIVVGGVLHELATMVEASGQTFALDLETIAAAVDCKKQTLRDLKKHITSECRECLLQQWEEFPSKSNFV